METNNEEKYTKKINSEICVGIGTLDENVIVVIVLEHETLFQIFIILIIKVRQRKNQILQCNPDCVNCFCFSEFSRAHRHL